MEIYSKRHLLCWIAVILWHFLAIRCAVSDIWLIFYVCIISDIFIILPQASHVKFVFGDKSLTIKRLIYPDILIYYHQITSVESSVSIKMAGRGGSIWTSTLGAYKICYKIGKKYEQIITPRDKKALENAFYSRIDNNLILFNEKIRDFYRI